jgi:ferredoxin
LLEGRRAVRDIPSRSSAIRPEQARHSYAKKSVKAISLKPFRRGALSSSSPARGPLCSMVAMLDQLASDPLDREVYFIHGSRSGDRHVLDARVRKVVAANKKLHRFVKYSRPNDLDVIGLDYDAKGRISIEDIQRILPSLDADYYLCGPVPLLKDLVPALVERGIEKERLRYEFFGLGTPLFDARVDNFGEPELDAGGKPIMVTFAKSGLTVPWTGNKPSLLILAEHSGLRPAQSCRNGLCEVCICRLDSGKVQHEGEIINLPKEGDVMICCARPLTSVMIDI